MKKNILLFIVIVVTYCQFKAQNNNGVIDTVSELYKKENIKMPMHDGIKLNTDVYYPKFMDNYKSSLNIPVPSLGQSDSLIFIKKGTMIFKYPNQADSSQLPVVFLRTPYDSRNAGANVYIFPLLGYTIVAQDERGRYLSEGTFAPFYNDGWKKAPYNTGKFMLDPSPDSSMNYTEDGAESISFITDSLQVDVNDDGLLDFNLSNGSVGMYGGSAEGYSQYQAAAARLIDPNQKGLKCLTPLVATGEFQQSTSMPNGVFREALTTGWLTHVMSNVDTNSVDISIYDTIHTPIDYGLTTVQQLIDTTIYAYTSWNQISYPYSPYRVLSDISEANVDVNGNGQTNGAYSRYRNMNVPMMHVSGWWDIFINGQIETFNNIRNNVDVYSKTHQKLIIGPWTHQTITKSEVGDQKGIYAYPNSVYDIFGQFDMASATSSDNFVRLLNSELVTWYRGYLGEPKVVFPANDWQKWSSTSIYKVKIPATNYQMNYETFVNFILGTQGLPNFSIALKDTTTGISTVYNINLPATSKSIFGDTATLIYTSNTPVWDETLPNGVKPVRIYVVGPTQDPLNSTVGNYWVYSDFFPSGSNLQKWYFSSNNSIDTVLQTTTDSLNYISDPNNPVGTMGGGNMVIKTPDSLRNNNGQMNMITWDSLTMNRPDVLQFSSLPLTDTLSVIGYPKISLWASLTPLNSTYVDSANGDFVVRIVDVYPDGREMYVIEGAVNARAREYAKSKALSNTNDNAPWSNLASGSIYNFYFNSLPIAYTFGKNHKIKILISSSNYPRYQSSHNMPLNEDDFVRFKPGDNFTYNFNGNTVYPRQNNVNFYFGNNYPSYIQLPVFTNTLVGIASHQIENKKETVKIYPNPTNGNFILLSSEKIQKIELYNLTGKLLFSKNNFSDNKLNISLPINLSKGLYFVAVYTVNNQKITKKIILN